MYWEEVVALIVKKQEVLLLHMKHGINMPVANKVVVTSKGRPPVK